MKEFLFKVLNAATLGRGIKKEMNDFTMRFPTRYFRYFPKDYESDNFQFLKDQSRNGSVIIDIGAHIGLFAVRAAQIVGKGGKVYAFEPTPSTFSVLKETIKINNAGDIVQPQEEAVSEKDGLTLFYISGTKGDNSNSLVGHRRDRKQEKVEVKLVSLDSFVSKNNIRKVDLVKIDAEGVEAQVLKGAVDTLSKFKPKCILSLHPVAITANGDNLADIYDFLIRMEYKVFLDGKEISRGEFISKIDLFDVHLIH